MESPEANALPSLISMLASDEGAGAVKLYGIDIHAHPFDLLITQAATRGMLKTGSVAVKIEPNGDDTWRFNFFLDLLFDDAAHLIAWANGLEVTESRREQSFGIG
jgi:hypothetical protein